MVEVTDGSFEDGFDEGDDGFLEVDEVSFEERFEEDEGGLTEVADNSFVEGLGEVNNEIDDTSLGEGFEENEDESDIVDDVSSDDGSKDSENGVFEEARDCQVSFSSEFTSFLLSESLFDTANDHQGSPLSPLPSTTSSYDLCDLFKDLKDPLFTGP